MELLQTRILDWYYATKRDLPWRTTTDPYHILVSEMMLQQTQVERVLIKYKEFLELFPTLETLALASTADVIKAWKGLGFNRRALRLQEIAQQIVKLKKFPDKEKELLLLKGIGPYTASAISSFAFNQDIVVLDTNIRRVFHRIFLSDNLKQNETLTKELALIAEKALPRGKSRDWHNALMDLGATICTAQAPKCEKCPVITQCGFNTLLTKASDEEKTKLLSLTRVKNKQGTFKNSPRFFRGKILDYLRTHGTVEQSTLVENFSKEYKKDISFILLSLEKDKLLKIKQGKITLPE